MLKVEGNLDYVSGTIENAKISLEVDKELWDNLSLQDQAQYLADNGEIEIIDYSIGYDGITNIDVELKE